MPCPAFFPAAAFTPSVPEPYIWGAVEGAAKEIGAEFYKPSKRQVYLKSEITDFTKNNWAGFYNPWLVKGFYGPNAGNL